MKKIMTDSLAMRFSWSGQKSTIRFQDLFIAKLILSEYKTERFICYKYFNFFFRTFYLKNYFLYFTESVASSHNAANSKAIC